MRDKLLNFRFIHFIKKVEDQWMTHELLEFINDKDDLLKLSKRMNHKEDWDTARIARNLVAGVA